MFDCGSLCCYSRLLLFLLLLLHLSIVDNDFFQPLLLLFLFYFFFYLHKDHSPNIAKISIKKTPGTHTMKNNFTFKGKQIIQRNSGALLLSWVRRWGRERERVYTRQMKQPIQIENKPTKWRAQHSDNGVVWGKLSGSLAFSDSFSPLETVVDVIL